jgi:hypothetical protein
MANDDREAAQKKIRSVLATVSTLALRLNQWTIFMTKLRAVGKQLDDMVRYVSDTIKYPDAGDAGKGKLSDDAWNALKLMLDQLDESPMDDLRVPIKSANTVINRDCPVARDMGDLKPDLILDDLEKWLTSARKAVEDGSASNLKRACLDVQRKTLKHTLGCLQQVQHESQSLTTLVKELESCL